MLHKPLLIAVASLALLFGLSGAAATAQSVMRVEVGGGAVQNLALDKGKSAVVDLPLDAVDVLISNPSVVDAVLRTRRHAFVIAQTAGVADVVFFDAAGRKILSLNIRVDTPIGPLEDSIHRIAPTADVKVEPLNDGLVLTGTARSALEANTIQRMAERFVSKPESVVNMISVRGKDQVAIKVRVIEVQRSVIKQLGFSFYNNSVSSNGLQTTVGNTASFGVNGNFQGGVISGVTGQIKGFIPNGATGSATSPPTESFYPTWGAQIEAYESAGLLRSLAETTLTTVSGEGSQFLVGGEFPVPVSATSTGGVSVSFKPYGVGLGFTPVVFGDNLISLKVSTEVSEVSNSGSVTIANGTTSTGVTATVIPSLAVRRAENTVELQSGGAIMMAGMLQSKYNEVLASLPGLTSLPILGALFRSRDYLAQETELVVIVEAHLVQPVAPGQLQTPADGLQLGNDAEAVLLGRLNKVTRGDSAPAAADRNGQAAYVGPIGYAID